MTPQEQAELIAMIQQMIATNPPNPGQGAIAPPMDKYGNIEPFDLANQSKAFNVTQDWSDIWSDPAILGGMMPDTITPEMLQPTVTYEPLPGQKLLREAMANPDSLEAYIAEGVMTEGAAATIAGIQAIIADPNNPLYDELIAKVPLGELNPATQTMEPDTGYIKSLAEKYQNAIWDDPQPTMDENGQPILDPATQLPAVVTSEETPQAQWFRETGTPLPWDEWSTNDLASPLQAQRRDESFAKTAETENDWRQFREQSPAQMPLEGADREAYIRNLMQSNMTTPDYPGFTNQSNQTFETADSNYKPPSVSGEGAWDSVWNGTNEGGSGPNFGFLGDAANLYGEGMALAINPMTGMRKGADALGAAARWLGGLASSETSSAGPPPVAPDYPFAANANTPSRPAPKFRGDAAWATPEGGSKRGKGPARGSRYEAELRLRQEEKDRGPTGRKATPQSKKAWQATTKQRASNHKQLADEAMRRRMIAMLMANNVTPYTSTMNSRRNAAQQAGFGY